MKEETKSIKEMAVESKVEESSSASSGEITVESLLDEIAQLEQELVRLRGIISTAYFKMQEGK